MSDLPETWSEVPIGTVSRVVGGGTPPSKDPRNFTMPGEGIPWLTPADLSGYRGQSIERGKRDLTPAGIAACGATLLPKGTVLFSSRAPIGYVAIAANDISTNQGFKSFVLLEGFDSRYCYYQLKYLKPHAEMIATGTTFKELSGAVAATLPFKVAPLNEQSRIADKLDILLARVQACNDRLDAIPALLKRFREAVVSAGMAGELTEDWRPTSEVPEWAPTKLQTVCRTGHVITYGVIKLGDEVPDGTPCLRTSNVRWLRFENDGIKRIARELSAQYGRTVLSGDEVLVNVRGTLGGVAVTTSEMKGWNVSREIAVVPVDTSRLNPHYVALWIASDESQRWLGAMEKGVAYVGINIEDLRKLPIRLPPIEEQDEIVKRVQAYLSFADRIGASCSATRAHVQRLTPLTLAQAFRGELVPQDASDERASILLARLAAQRSDPASSSTSRAPRRGRPPRAPKETAAMTKSRQDDDVMNQPYLAGHLRRIGTPASAEMLFKLSELPVADFYKQLAWEVAEGYVKDSQTTLEPGHATG